MNKKVFDEFIENYWLNPDGTPCKSVKEMLKWYDQYNNITEFVLKAKEILKKNIINWNETNS